MAGLARGDYAALAEAIDREHTIIDEHAQLLKSQQGATDRARRRQPQERKQR